MVSDDESYDGRNDSGAGQSSGIGADLAEAAPEGVQSLLAQAVDLATFRQQEVRLTMPDRRRIVEQALVLIEQNYVHLPHKVAMHAVNPVQRLRLLQARLTRSTSGPLSPADDFHGELSEIFHALRDLHTNYLLPDPYRGQLAFLPFLVEEFYEDDRPKYLVTKVMEGAPTGDFAHGVEITHWNGMPIERAIELNAARYAGSNDAARHARGVESLTIRPLRIHRYPDEDWVVIGFQKNGTPGEFRQPWLVAPNLPPATAEDARIDESRTASGLDLDQDEAYRARKLLFAPAVAASELDPSADEPRPAQGEIETSLPSVFRARPVTIDQTEFGYVRIFTFNVSDPDAFVAEFVRLIEAMPRRGLIIDVRGNGGGHIWAAELILQTLTPAVITPEPTQFINSALNTEICRQHDRGQGGINLGPWLPSMEQAVETGATHSNAFSITPSDRANAVGQRYFGPAVLITDARCYSATDIFAGGFQDHGIGKVLGVDSNTGAGGANVWTHSLLSQLMNERGSVRSPYRALPAGVDMRVSIRRTLRVADAAGTPVEDLGVVPDEIHRMTRRDVDGANDDLIAHAAAMLGTQPTRRLDIDPATVVRGGTLELTITTGGMDRIDVYLDDRPVASVNVRDERPTTIRKPGAGALRLRLMGYHEGTLVANRRERLGPLPSGRWGVQPGATLVRAPAMEVPTLLRFLVAAGDADRATVRRAVQRTFGRRWTVEPLFQIDPDTPPPPDLQGYYAVTGSLRRGTDDQRRSLAFEMSRELMRRTGFDVQPDLPSGAMYPPVGVYDLDAQDPTIDGAGAQSAHLPGTENPRWALESMRVPGAWTQEPSRGAGISVAQPDTGVTAQPELQPGIDTARQRDLLDNDNDATDPLTRRWWWMDNPGHGTATASVVMSRDPGTVTGSAPGSSLVPLRAIRSVVLVFDGDVARAVEYARRSGCHVITMSLGGVGFSPALRAAINAAIDDGIIVLAAAGNQVGFVVSPANYAEVVAVAATNVRDEPWSGSSHGQLVDISAPGESVHTARARKGADGPVFSVGRSAGTSFAVALTAGVAALWLAHHGRENLISRYGKAALQAVFIDLVRRTARRPTGWDGSQYGAGIVDADALLARALPAAAPSLPREPVALSAEERLAAYLPGQSADQATAALEAILPAAGDDERDLYAGELAYYLSQDPYVRGAVDAFVTEGFDSTAAAADSVALGLARLRTMASPSLAARLA
ncbi:MAG TPA: S8 family serine peptidase [Jiangellaceae bacterium]